MEEHLTLGKSKERELKEGAEQPTVSGVVLAGSPEVRPSTQSVTQLPPLASALSPRTQRWSIQAQNTLGKTISLLLTLWSSQSCTWGRRLLLKKQNRTLRGGTRPKHYPFRSGLSGVCRRGEGPARPQVQGPGCEKTLSRITSSDRGLTFGYGASPG